MWSDDEARVRALERVYTAIAADLDDIENRLGRAEVEHRANEELWFIPPGGVCEEETSITFTVTGCDGLPIAGIDVEIQVGNEGESVDILNETTDAAGVAVFDLTDYVGSSGTEAVEWTIEDPRWETMSDEIEGGVECGDTLNIPIALTDGTVAEGYICTTCCARPVADTLFLTHPWGSVQLDYDVGEAAWLAEETLSVSFCGALETCCGEGGSLLIRWRLACSGASWTLASEVPVTMCTAFLGEDELVTYCMPGTFEDNDEIRTIFESATGIDDLTLTTDVCDPFELVFEGTAPESCFHDETIGNCDFDIEEGVEVTPPGCGLSLVFEFPASPTFTITE